MVTAVVETLITILKTNLEILKSGEFTTNNTNKEEEEEEENEENEEEVVNSFDWSQGPSKALEVFLFFFSFFFSFSFFFRSS